MADDEWYARIEGLVNGPFSSRTLKTMALLGDLIPTGEVRYCLDGNWQPASLIKGLQFKSSVRAAPPPVPQTDEKAEAAKPPRYRYKMVQLPPSILIGGKTPEGSAAAAYLQSIVDENAI